MISEGEEFMTWNTYLGKRTPINGITITEASSCFGNYRTKHSNGAKTRCDEWIKKNDPMCIECRKLTLHKLDRILFEE